MTRPTFAALIPNYNDSANIGKSIRCIIEQTIPFDELIIIDDASTDDSIKVINDLIKDIPYARLHCNKQNIGVVAALNLGFGLAKSDYIHMVSANDLYSTRIVEHDRKILQHFPNAVMISANSTARDATKDKPGTNLIMRLPQVKSFISKEDYISRNSIAPVSMNGGSNTIRRDVYIELGGQDEELKWYADWFLYFLIGFTHGFAYVPEIYATSVLDTTNSYSVGMHDWQQQKPTILRVISLLKERYPEQAELFRKTAILPRYNLKVLMAVMERQYRWFVTPLLIWRCLGHQSAFWLKTVIPRQLLTTARAFFRL